MHILQKLTSLELARPPSWMKNNVMYLTQMGSTVYGAATDESDIDVYGFAIPPKRYIFPHVAGNIPGFGTQIKPFEQWQKHHIINPNTKKEYDFTVYSIVKYFNLVLQNNPNMIDSLFTPSHAVLHITNVGTMVKDARHSFLHKGVWNKFRGYAYGQLTKMNTKVPKGKRVKTIEKYGYDVKFAYHIVRLMLEVEQLLNEQDLELNRNGDLLKSIKTGGWKKEEVIEFFDDKKISLEKAYNESKLPSIPNEAKVKQLLIDCLEEHYGSISDLVTLENKSDVALNQILEILHINGYN